MKKFYLAVATILIASIFACQKKETTLLEQLDPAETGIQFANRITENDTFNILDFEFVYNGGGVAAGDFNNDGLQDLYFTGNTADNRLYINKGDFKFEDQTETAGVAGKGRWCSGVAAVDVNADGWLDLYVCATVYEPGARRKTSCTSTRAPTAPRSNSGKWAPNTALRIPPIPPMPPFSIMTTTATWTCTSS